MQIPVNQNALTYAITVLLDVLSYRAHSNRPNLNRADWCIVSVCVLCQWLVRCASVVTLGYIL